MYYLNEDLFFPSVNQASREGILAVGGDLSVKRLLLAYEKGIFPWFDAHEPILWWAPPKRMVVYPKNYKIPRSMRNVMNQNKFEVIFDQNFESVIKQCQSVKRNGQEGTWITQDIIDSYCKLHQLGIAKSVEVFQNNKLVGGLYGIDLGHIFCGESMFSLVSNASKVAFIWLVNYLKTNNYTLLDCQVHNHHLENMGAFEISREEFMTHLHQKKSQTL
jgi:leucyl/phenylalanyl-tRNA---protein transferase